MPAFTKLTPDQIQQYQLLRTQNNAPTIRLTPREKFDRLILAVGCRSSGKIRTYHFKAIEHGEKIYLFNGIGEEIAVFINDHNGQREARLHAVGIFTNSPKDSRDGGYKFDFCRNNSEMEYL